MKRLLPQKKHRSHEKIKSDYPSAKQKHLEKLATKMLNNDEKLSQLKGKKINNNILNLF